MSKQKTALPEGNGAGGGELKPDALPVDAGQASADVAAQSDLAPAGSDDVPPTQDEGAPAEFVMVRVLVDCVHGCVNALVQLEADQLASAKAAGQVDDHPDAVNYAASLNAGA